AGGSYSEGGGTVFVIDGTGGDPFSPLQPTSPSAADFVSVMDPTSNAAHGFMEYTVSPTELTGRLIRSAGAAFSDAVAITSPTGEEAPFAGDLNPHTTAETGVPLVLHGSDN